MKTLRFLILILTIISFSVNAQSPEWINYTAGSEVHRIVQEGNFLWITGGGINKYNILTGENINYNKANSGLPENYVTSIAVDKNGIKWIGTRSSQLAKFDGTTWVVYNPINSPLPLDCGVNDLAVDSNNVLWIGSWGGGIIRFDGNTWTIYDHNNTPLLPVNNNRVYTWCITVDQNNNIWAGLTGGLARFDGNNWTIYDTSNSSLPGLAVSSIKVDRSNTKWIGTQQGGLVSFNDTTWQSTVYGTGYYFDAISIDKDGYKWLGCTNGDKLMKLSTTGSELIPAPSGIMSIFIDNNNNKWIGTITKGLFLLDSQNNWISKKIGNSGLLEDKMKSLFVDKNNNIWAGTDGNGLSMFDGKNWTNFTQDFGTISSIKEDNKGNIWIGSNHWLGKYDGTNMILYNEHNSGMPENPSSGWPLIRDIAIDKNGIIWIGTLEGLVEFDGNTDWKVFNTSNSSIPDNRVESVVVDSSGNIWLGQVSVVTKFDGQNWARYLCNSLPYGMFFDHRGNLWVGGPCNIVSKFNGSVWTDYPFGFNCVSIIEDSSSNIWLGTWDGLQKYDGTTVTTYNSFNSGLPSNYIQAISFDKEGNLWIATDGGGLAVFKAKLAESSTWQADINVKDNGNIYQSLTFGQSPIASDEIDQALGEAPLPPPAFGFDTRFHLPTGEESWKDIRKTGMGNIEWLIKFQPGEGGYPITFSWDPAQIPSIGGFSLKDLITGTIVNVNMKTDSSFTLTNSGITTLKIVLQPDAPLPTELTSFTANSFDNNVNITWETSTEKNNSGFEIQRSKDGNVYDKIGFVKGNGTTTEIHKYVFTDKNVPSVKIYYRLKQIDYCGKASYSNAIEVVQGLPTAFSLSQNYPNPFNSSTVIKYGLPGISNVQIKIHNLIGQVVESLVDGTQSAGYHEIMWNASNKASGIYLYTIETIPADGKGNFRSAKKLILMK